MGEIKILNINYDVKKSWDGVVNFPTLTLKKWETECLALGSLCQTILGGHAYKKRICIPML